MPDLWPSDRPRAARGSARRHDLHQLCRGRLTTRAGRRGCRRKPATGDTERRHGPPGPYGAAMGHLRRRSLAVAALVVLTGCPHSDDGAVPATTTPSCAMPDIASHAWIEEGARQQPMGWVDPGAPGGVAHIGPWDSTVTWSYREELDVTTES